MTDKETRILEAVLELLRSGAGPHALKISEIAQLAGVGKGTVYEYFETKEQLLIRAVLFSLEREVVDARAYILKRRSFYDQFMALLDMAARAADSGFSSMRMLMAGAGSRDICTQACEIDRHGSGFLEQIAACMEELLEQGYAEGRIQRPQSRYYALTVLKSALCGYMFKAGRGAEQDGEARQAAFEIVCKTLA